MRRKEQLLELRERSLPELEQELTETRQRLFQDRIRYATRNLDNPGPLRAGRKRIARILTLLREAQGPAADGRGPGAGRGSAGRHDRSSAPAHSATARKKNGKRNR
jgi:ribosomal protein L29